MTRRGSWGPWHLDRAQWLLWTGADGYRYEIDLDSCTSSAEVLDWICQIAAKMWGDSDAERAAITAGLVQAFADVLNPQANLCPRGHSKRLSRSQVRRMVSRAADAEGGRRG